jgi:hypothetical protein
MGTKPGSGRPQGSRDVIILCAHLVLVPLWVLALFMGGIMTGGLERGLLYGLVGALVGAADIGYRVWLVLSRHRSPTAPPQGTIKRDGPPGVAPDR